MNLSDATPVEGEVVTLSGKFQDAGIQDGHAVVIDWGDGYTSSSTGATPDIVVDDVNQTFTVTHKYVDANYQAKAGQFKISATVTDDSNASGFSTVPISVSNVMPTVASLTLTNTTNPGVTPTEADVVSLYAVFSDPGSDSPFNAVIDWGDGT